MALLDAVLLGDEIDPDVGEVRPTAEVVMPHQAIEVHGARHTDVTGVIGHFRDGGQKSLEFTHDGARPLERRALVHVQHQQHLVLVVEREHLEWHRASRGQTHRADCQEADDDQECGGPEP